MSKYLELISRNAEEAEKANAEHKVSAAHLQLKSDILEAKRLAAAADVDVDKIKSTYPLDSEAYLAAKVEKEAALAQLKDLEELEKELFSEGK